MNTDDKVDRAFELLRGGEQLELPNRELERELRRLHARRRQGSSRRYALAVAVCLGLGLTGAALAASGGFDGLKACLKACLKAWWFRVVIDGESRTMHFQADGEHSFEYRAVDGTRIQVVVARSTKTHAGSETGIRIHQQREGFESIDEEVVRRSAEQPISGLTVEVLAGLEPIHVHQAVDGRRLALYLAPAPGRDGALCLIHDLTSSGPRPVRSLHIAGRSLDQIENLRIEEQPDGIITLALDDGGQWELVLGLSPEDGTAPDHPHFESPDGRVKVDLGD